MAEAPRLSTPPPFAPAPGISCALLEPRYRPRLDQLKKRSVGSSSGSAGTATFDRSAGVAPICAAHMRSWFIAPTPTSSPVISLARRYEAISTSARSNSISHGISRRNSIPGDALSVVHPVGRIAERRGMRCRSASKSGRIIPVGASNSRLLARGSRPRHWWLPRYLNWRAMRKHPRPVDGRRPQTFDPPGRLLGSAAQDLLAQLASLGDRACCLQTTAPSETARPIPAGCRSVGGMARLFGSRSASSIPNSGQQGQIEPDLPRSEPDDFGQQSGRRSLRQPKPLCLGIGELRPRQPIRRATSSRLSPAARRRTRAPASRSAIKRSAGARARRHWSLVRQRRDFGRPAAR